MGASGWKYFVPYQADIGQALLDLRNEVFRSGQYYKLNPDREPVTIEELLEMNGEQGTHSILDIFMVAAHLDYGMAAPLSRDELIRYFGTDRPTRTEVEDNPAALDDIQTRRGRWLGSYIIIHEGGAPSEILFFGHSGD
jgi:hypothetical protein